LVLGAWQLLRVQQLVKMWPGMRAEQLVPGVWQLLKVRQLG